MDLWGQGLPIREYSGTEDSRKWATGASIGCFEEDAGLSEDWIEN